MCDRKARCGPPCQVRHPVFEAHAVTLQKIPHSRKRSSTSTSLALDSLYTCQICVCPTGEGIGNPPAPRRRPPPPHAAEGKPTTSQEIAGVEEGLRAQGMPRCRRSPTGGLCGPTARPTEVFEQAGGEVIMVLNISEGRRRVVGRGRRWGWRWEARGRLAVLLSWVKVERLVRWHATGSIGGLRRYSHVGKQIVDISRDCVSAGCNPPLCPPERRPGSPARAALTDKRQLGRGPALTPTRLPPAPCGRIHDTKRQRTLTGRTMQICVRVT